MIAAALLVLALGDTVPATEVLGDVRCAGEPVRTIEVRAKRPPFKGQMKIWRRVARAVGLHHTTTRDGVVRRFVTLDEGAPCSEFRLAESERLLRGLPFLASASVRTEDAGDGGVRVVVETVDEVPALGGLHLGHGGVDRVSAGTMNLYGLGLTTELGVERGRGAYRDGVRGRLVHYQFLGRPYVLALDGARDPAGARWSTAASHPFLTDLQRIAWYAGVREQREYLPLAHMDHRWLTLGVRRGSWDAGGALRIGNRSGRTAWLAGGALSAEHASADHNPTWLLDTAMAPAPAALLDSSDGDGYAAFRAARIGPMVGMRRLSFVTVRGMDALTAEQDLARGVQVAAMVQHGIARRGEDDWLVSTDMFAGTGGPSSYGGVQLSGEARRGRRSSSWDGVLASGRAAWYLKPSLPLTTVLSLEAAGGRRLRYPMLLELGSGEGGMRGLGGDPILGTTRAVARLEQRWFAGPVRDRGDLGFALFTDVGRSWAGWDGLASTTPVIATGGLSILAAVPRGAQRTVRIDFATGLHNAPRSFEVRLTLRDPTRAFWSEPGDVAHLRASRGLMNVLSWP